MKHFRSPFLLMCLPALPILYALIVSPPAAAQPTRLLEDVLGFDEVRPVARVLFHQDGGELCATLAVNRGPLAIHKNMFLFRRLVEPKVKGTNGRLVFPFNKQPDRVEGTIQAWIACTDSPARVEEADRDVVELTVRNANSTNESLKLFVEYPAANESSGMDVLDDGAGGLIGQGYIRPL